MNRLSDFSHWTGSNRWIWSAIAIVAVWLILSTVTQRFSLGNLSGIVLSAAFLSLVGLGQMFVMTTGRGNIDLSIASVMTLNAFLALIVIHGEDRLILPGIATAVGIGLLTGLFNATLVVVLRIPAIIATLSTGYVLATASLMANRAIPGFFIAPSLRTLASGRIADIPFMTLIAAGAILVAGFSLRYTAYGRKLGAVGQSVEAARLAGIHTGRVTAAAFVISSLAASLTGLLLGAYVGGAFLEMGQPYLLQSIAAVVLGGTPVFGGSATALGTLFASILLILIVTTMQVIGLPPGAQDMVQGVVVILVLSLAGRDVLQRRRVRTIPMASAL